MWCHVAFANYAITLPSVQHLRNRCCSQTSRATPMKFIHLCIQPVVLPHRRCMRHLRIRPAPSLLICTTTSWRISLQVLGARCPRTVYRPAQPVACCNARLHLTCAQQPGMFMYHDAWPL